MAEIRHMVNARHESCCAFFVSQALYASDICTYAALKKRVAVKVRKIESGRFYRFSDEENEKIAITDFLIYFYTYRFLLYIY